jgi:tripartite-type tricarboxylate transporter receptor subunit TctC
MCARRVRPPKTNEETTLINHGSSRASRHVGLALPAMCAAMMAPSLHAADQAAAYPTKPIRWVVPFAPGGGVDVVARAIGDKLSSVFGKPVVVDNRAGAAGTIGTELVAASPPDGHTIMSTSSSVLVNQALREKPTYDLRAMSAITQLTAQPYIITVHSSVPARTMAELIALAKSKPGTLTYASSGTGSIQHLSGALISKMAGVSLVHVPYKGGGAAHIDLVAGQVLVEATLPLTTYPYVKQGRLRYLAVTSKTRLKAFPDIPPVADTLPGYDIVAWYGMLAPAKTPRPIITRLNAEIVKILKMPEIGGKFAADGTEPVGSTPEAFHAHLVSEYAKWHDVAQSIGLKAE